MSLMAELGQGTRPPTSMPVGGYGGGITGARPQIHQHQSRVITSCNFQADCCVYSSQNPNEAYSLHLFEYGFYSHQFRWVPLR